MTCRVAVQARQQLLHFELMADVERRRRLVEQQQLGILRQRAGDHDALLFAAAERVEQTRGERRRPGGLEGPLRHGEVFRAFERERAEVGKRPINTISRTLKSNGACVSCGT